MTKYNTPTRVSFSFVLATVAIVLLAYIALEPPPAGIGIRWGTFAWLIPPVLGFPGIVAAVNGFVSKKTVFAFSLIVINLLFVSWYFLCWPLVTLLFGP